MKRSTFIYATAVALLAALFAGCNTKTPQNSRTLVDTTWKSTRAHIVDGNGHEQTEVFDEPGEVMWAMFMGNDMVMLKTGHSDVALMTPYEYKTKSNQLTVSISIQDMIKHFVDEDIIPPGVNIGLIPDIKFKGSVDWEKEEIVVRNEKWLANIPGLFDLDGDEYGSFNPQTGTITLYFKQVTLPKTPTGV